MKKTHIIVIVVVALAIIIGLLIGLGMKEGGLGYQGNIGVIEIEGIIESAKKTVRDIKRFKEDPAIPAVIIRVDSPGGGVAAAQEIYEEIKKLKEKKKVVVSMGALAASGGYYVSLPADIIVANPGTITGSIGVIMEFTILEELMKKLGIDFEVVKSREHKDIGSPFRKMSEKEKKLLQEVVSDVYEQFVDAVFENRKIPRDSILKFADGRIITGHQAKKLGLVDTLGSFEDAVKIAGDLVGIEKPNLIYPPKRFSLIQLITEPVETILIPKIYFLWK
uniref:Signal peptide peptidase SppA n=1 Tax=candidate division WOR-3 bacterium TaxID=2052148 RepID=A0A7C4XAQ7_UNCW3